jgi:DNA-binding IclR family transcriptional regulator
MSQRKPDSPSRAVPHADDTPLKTTAPAVVRAVNILDVVALAREPISLGDLTRETGVPKSTLHGLCDTLIKLGLIRKNSNGGMSIGSYVMNWANAFLSQTSLTEEFQSMWEASSAFPRETVTLSVLDGSQVIYLSCRNGDRPLGITFRIGMALPAPYTATGKAMLSTMPAVDITRLFSGAWPEPLTKASVSGYKELVDELEQVRRDGYSIDNGQMREGMICFGAPVFDATQPHAIAGLAVSLLATEIDEATGVQIGKDIRRLADELSVRLGGGAQIQAH